MPHDLVVLASDESVRFYDQDGRMHVRTSHISKANICPYRGREIPQADTLGLDPDKVYYLLRAPEELEKGAGTFNNLPILSKHVPVNSADLPKELIIGSTGTEAKFNDPYLDNSLAVWTDEAIAGVESGQQREISSAYHYVPDMTPGEYNGAHYDGVMRQLRGNHVAFVEDGRAGSDVLVMDSAMDTLPSAGGARSGEKSTKVENRMPAVAKRVTLSPRAAVVVGALGEFLRPKLAQDQKMPDLGRIMLGVDAKNYAQRLPSFEAAIKRAMKPVLAQDADMSDVHSFLDHFGGKKEEGGAPEEVAAPEKKEEAKDVDVGPPDPLDTNPHAQDDDLEMKIRDLLQGKLDDADLEMLLKLVRPEGEEAPPEAEEAPPQKPDQPSDDFSKDNRMGRDNESEAPVMKPAMDKAIKIATDLAVTRAVRETTQRLQARNDAEKFVRPWVGEIVVAMDSADEVYKFALEKSGVDIEGVHPSAYRSMLALVPKPGEDAPRSRPRIAQDAGAAKSFYDRFPAAQRMRVVG